MNRGRGNILTSKQLFSIGYVTSVIALTCAYFIDEPQSILAPILTLTLLFGVYPLYIDIIRPRRQLKSEQ
ncbi:hypothetical protein H9659_13600 [Sporosarcina sp. Sa3CUA8]|uniref:Uncharacterized protein n=1 Tax=Sporosarcina gallistercoris TaxID=2762245 RepID=A0ABR8PMG4_9BACL|nr:hypothetical protein [Sporosarcina gallistercoris]